MNKPDDYDLYINDALKEQEAEIYEYTMKEVMFDNIRERLNEQHRTIHDKIWSIAFSSMENNMCNGNNYLELRKTCDIIADDMYDLFWILIMDFIEKTD